MEIHQKLHSILGSPFADGDGVVNIAVAAAVAPAFPVIGIIPDPHPDIVDAVFTEDLIDILFYAVVIVVFYAAILQGRHAGSVHAQDKILRQIFNLLYIERIGIHRHILLRFRCPLLGCAAGGEQ